MSALTYRVDRALILVPDRLRARANLIALIILVPNVKMRIHCTLPHLVTGGTLLIIVVVVVVVGLSHRLPRLSYRNQLVEVWQTALIVFWRINRILFISLFHVLLEL